MTTSYVTACGSAPDGTASDKHGVGDTPAGPALGQPRVDKTVNSEHAEKDHCDVELGRGKQELTLHRWPCTNPDDQGVGDRQRAKGQTECQGR